MKALQSAFPDIAEDEEQPLPRKINFPKPISEPSSPASTRATTPTSSHPGSDDDASHDSEEEEAELKAAVSNMHV